MKVSGEPLVKASQRLLNHVVNFSVPPCWLPLFLHPTGVFVSGPAVLTVSCNDSWTLPFVYLVHVLGFLWLHSTKPPPLEVDWEDYGSGNTLIQAIVFVPPSEVLTTASRPPTHTPPCLQPLLVCPPPLLICSRPFRDSWTRQADLHPRAFAPVLLLSATPYHRYSHSLLLPVQSSVRIATPYWLHYLTCTSVKTGQGLQS